MKEICDLDAVDLQLLQILQQEGRLSNAKLAERLALSEAPCWRRLRRLEQENIIQGYRANLNREKLGFGVVVFAQIRLGEHASEAPIIFENQVRDIPQILACYNVSGECDYMLLVVAENLEAYGNFVRDQLRTLAGVVSIQSNLALQEIKATYQLPI
ncbi:DNA-binding transcriptional regulator, Lrp family [Allopseudospirillum japonicum]|uniref:DNA-binding transcriptional regulator, Lrp family n=1 Tax=Allopseudospirillum japonicum TaxID=64971 RepID=A0A1H6TW65_9GAMM|nr:Lrp/AsnC family transcriptional regulator [Allopseudospirillum japonicum]SEI83456.1 DNA-binding transcriptional regulator, Lrp family [Allopseudospirillum japonicum]